MLLDLYIENFILIDKLNISFSNGMNVLTGETGAGKSIIFEAIGLILGSKGNRGYVKSGSSKAVIQGTFDVDENVEKFLSSENITFEDDYITITREINLKGKSLFKLNGRVIGSYIIVGLGNFLVNISGQHEHQMLLNPSSHLKIIDEYGSSSVETTKEELSDIVTEIKELESQKNKYDIDDLELNKKIDFLNYQIDEIEKIELVDGEDIELENKFDYLSNFEGIKICMDKLSDMLGGEYGINDKLSEMLSEFNKFNSMDSKIKNISEQLESSYYTLQNLATDTSSLSMDFEFDEEALEKTEERLNVINSLKRKYGNSIEDINVYFEEIKSEYDELTAFVKNKSVIDEKIDNLQREYFELAKVLTVKRKEISCDFALKLKKELSELNFDGLEFEVDFKETENISKKGIDHVEFLISSNKGAPLKAIKKVASGGELSRIMLGIKLVNNNGSFAYTQIFDEIDSGISGRTASAVGEKLKKISNDSQVILVTHLPQIAIYGDNHYIIEKNMEDDRTSSNIELLDEERRILEICRMIGGDEITSTTMENARELLKSVKTV